MKICFVTDDYPPAAGGLAVAARRVVGFLVEEGWTVHVVTPAPRDEARPRGGPATTFEHGATVHRLTVDNRQDSLFNFRQFVRELEQRVGFDLFHGFYLTSVPHCVAAAQTRPPSSRPPVIASIRGGDVCVMPLHPFLLTYFVKALKKASWVTSVNRTYLEEMGQRVDLAGKSSVIRNSVAPAGEGWGPGTVERGTVGTTGEFRPGKDIPLLIRGYRHVPAGLRRRLMLVGAFTDPHEQSWSEALADEFGLRDQIHLTGYLPHAEVGDHLRRMNVYVHSSAREGMPNSLLEAAAHGVPIVATECAGVKEILTDGVDALLAPHGYPQALGAAIERVLADPELGARLSEASRRLAARYSLAAERREWIELYRRLLRPD